MVKQTAPEGVITRIKAIFALYERATTDNERDVAKSKLDALLEKYGLTIDSLGLGGVQSVRSIIKFKYDDDDERKILIHIAGRMLGYDEKGYVTFYRVTRARKTIGFMLSPVQAIDFEAQMTYYSNDWREQKALFMQAYLENNALARKTDAPCDVDFSVRFSEKDLWAMRRMRAALPSRTFANPALGEGQKRLTE